MASCFKKVHRSMDEKFIDQMTNKMSQKKNILSYETKETM